MTVNRTAAFLLNIAIRKVFPAVKCCFSEGDLQGFSCEFSYSEVFSEDYLRLIENTMKELSREEIRVMEMLGSNAKDFFLHRGQKELAKSLDGVGGTVFVAQIGEFADLCEGELDECKYFSLLELHQEKRRVCIEGVAFASGRDQKAFLKKLKQYPKKNHQYLAKLLELYEEESWHPKGMQLRRVLIDLWRGMVKKEGFEEVETPDPAGYFAQTEREKFSCWKGLREINYSFSEDSTHSSLQFIQKWINIFTFEYRWVLVRSHQKKTSRILEKALCSCDMEYHTIEEEAKTAQIELHIQDAMGRYWVGPRLRLEKGGVSFSLFGDIKRFIALLLEKFEGELPFWLFPEQVRVLSLGALGEVNLGPLVEIFNRQGIRYSVDEGPAPLKEKMHRALHAKVPCVMVFGKQEEKLQQLKIRTYGSSMDKAMTLDKIEQFLAERKVEN